MITIGIAAIVPHNAMADSLRRHADRCCEMDNPVQMLSEL